MRKSKYKIGDKVRVTRIAASHKNGWTNSWNSCMDCCVGKLFSVVQDHKRSGYTLDTRAVTSCNYSFPEFVLEPEIKPGEQLEFDFMKG